MAPGNPYSLREKVAEGRMRANVLLPPSAAAL